MTTMVRNDPARRHDASTQSDAPDEADSSSQDLRVGNKYRIGRKIGSGSFGDIYLGGFWPRVGVGLNVRANSA
jgi:hypothetical protein